MKRGWALRSPERLVGRHPPIREANLRRKSAEGCHQKNLTRDGDKKATNKKEGPNTKGSSEGKELYTKTSDEHFGGGLSKNISSNS